MLLFAMTCCPKGGSTGSGQMTLVCCPLSLTWGHPCRHRSHKLTHGLADSDKHLLVPPPFSFLPIIFLFYRESGVTGHGFKATLWKQDRISKFLRDTDLKIMKKCFYSIKNILNFLKKIRNYLIQLKSSDFFTCITTTTMFAVLLQRHRLGSALCFSYMYYIYGVYFLHTPHAATANLRHWALFSLPVSGSPFAVAIASASSVTVAVNLFWFFNGPPDNSKQSI